MRRFSLGIAMGLLIALTALVPDAHAALERRGPISSAPTVGGFPAWFQDKTGLTFEFCDLLNPAELTGGWCVLIPPGPAYPETFPSNFFGEHFYFRADTAMKDATVKARLTIGVEAAFVTPLVVPGDQMTFGRIRVLVNPLPFDGTYTVYHPYGVWTFPDQVAGDRLFFTEDIGIACPGTFACTLGTSIGPFLLPSPYPGGPEVPPVPDIVRGQDPFYDILVNTGATTPYPGTGKRYIADPARIGPVTGSPLPPFMGNDNVPYDHNTFRIEGPNGWVLQTNSFQLGGRVMTGTIPGRVTIDRATYAPGTAGSPSKVDVFATAFETTQGRTPAQPTPPKVTPILSAFDAPCLGASVDPASGEPLPPLTEPTAFTSEVEMSASGPTYWGQMQPANAPLYVCVEDYTSRNAAGQVVPAFYSAKVMDEVYITKPNGWGADWQPSKGGTLTVTAVSSDPNSMLTLAGYKDPTTNTPMVFVNGQAIAGSVLAPPAKVHVVSNNGGAADLLVTTGRGAAVSETIPLAVNDEVTMYEDCSPIPASTCATPLIINPWANDKINGRLITADDNPVIVITGPPRIGTMVLCSPGVSGPAGCIPGTIIYTPNTNVNGTEGIAYTVSINGVQSNQAYITIAITPVNDAPVAVNDTTSAVVSRLNTVNVIANDTDPDGSDDIVNAVVINWPVQLGAKSVTAGVVSFTPTSTGVFVFTYKAVDKAGVQSATPATVTVTVAGSEAITITKAIYKQGNIGGGISARWTVTGADSVREGQTMSVVYVNGTLKAGGSCNGTTTLAACVIGTATVDPLGNYTVDFVAKPGGALDPTDANTWSTKPTSLKVYSTAPVLGGSQSTGIQLK
jgi:cadherin-like protein